MTAASNSESRKRLAESAAVETALSDDERDALAEAAYRRTVAWSRTATTPWSSLHDFQREQQRNPGVERVVETILAARIEQARAEGAAEVVARVEALADLFDERITMARRLDKGRKTNLTDNMNAREANVWAVAALDLRTALDGPR